MKRLVAVVVLLGSAVVYGQIMVPPGSLLGWDQVAPDLATAQGYTYKVYANGAPTGTVVTATCSGTASPYLCTTPFPLTSSGTIVVSATNSVGESKSPAVSFQIGTAPVAPANVRPAAPTTQPPPAGGLAALYPGDVGIEADPAVVFVEKFDEATLTALFNRYNDVHNGAGMSFFSDVPTKSPLAKSIDISWVGGTNDGGHLYKLLSPGVDDVLYVRYYVKYPTVGAYRHEGVWLGGYNPPLPYPFPHAGEKPAGNDRFLAVAEQTDDQSHVDNYDYWMGMHVHGDGKYWGNSLTNDRTDTVTEGQWACVEQMVKLNNPVSSLNGEHAFWLNGTKRSHVGLGFPTGTWTWGMFTQGAGAPFDGMQWRSTSALNINFLNIENYSPDDPAGVTSSIRYAHVVAATRYIGCLA